MNEFGLRCKASLRSGGRITVRPDYFLQYGQPAPQEAQFPEQPEPPEVGRCFLLRISDHIASATSARTAAIVMSVTALSANHFILINSLHCSAVRPAPLAFKPCPVRL